MVQTGIPNDKSGDLNIHLYEFAVVLLAESINPSILNPDFLRYNEIVQEGWQVQDTPDAFISVPGFSQVKYNDGLSVRTEANRVVFEQKSDPLNEGTIACVDMAKRYLKTLPHVKYTAVGFNPKGYKAAHSRKPNVISTAFVDSGDWMSFHGVKPDFQIKVIYALGDKKLVLDVSEGRGSDNTENSQIRFQANIHRDVPDTNQQNRIETLIGILDSWRTDLLEFTQIVSCFPKRK